MGKNLDLKGKYALVTGASTGIGNAVALDLAREGVNLALCALPSEKKVLDDLAAKLAKNQGIKTWSFGIDLAAQDGPRTLYAEARKLLPHLDILVNCAGIDIHGFYHEIPFDFQDRLLKVNVRAYMALMHLALPEMIERRQGRILNVVSMGAFQPLPFLATYAASKAFLQSLSEAVNRELKGTGVIVSTLNPNNVDTPLLAKLPQDMKLMKTNPPIRPEVVAAKAVDAIRRGKKISVVTIQDWITAFVVPRLFPRAVVNYVAFQLLKSKNPISSPIDQSRHP